MTFDNRTTELIAIGASVAANCQSCVEYHFARAAEYGIEQSELAQAVEIGRTVRKGAASNLDRTADRLLQKGSSSASGATGGRTSASEACCGSAFKGTVADDAGGAPTSFPGRCTPASLMETWCSGGFPFREEVLKHQRD